MDITSLTIHELSERLKKKETSSVEITKAFLARIGSVEPKIHSFITVTTDGALEAARLADKRLAEGKDITPLTGVPISVKDIFLSLIHI